MTKTEKDRIVQEIRDDIGNLQCEAPHRACLFWAILTAKALGRHQIPCIIQGGSLSWPIIREEEDDGVQPSHFSFCWEEGSLITLERISQGLLPEMHVWVGIPGTKEIVDVTTRYLKQQCKETSGLDWLSDDPPDYFWADRENTPPLVYYRVHPLATLIATKYANNILQKRRLT